MLDFQQKFMTFSYFLQVDVNFGFVNHQRFRILIDAKMFFEFFDRATVFTKLFHDFVTLDDEGIQRFQVFRFFSKLTIEIKFF